MNISLSRQLAALLVSTSLVACGGGGGGSSPDLGAASIGNGDTSGVSDNAADNSTGNWPQPLPSFSGGVNVTYSVSNAMITNPERGMYFMLSCNSPLQLSQLKDFRSSYGHSLGLCLFLLDDAISSPISQDKLNLFQQQMDTLRSAGMKTVLRFAYNSDGSNVDASPAMVATHLDQLKPYLEKNKDVIAVVQTGFIGPWGEWDISRNFGDYSTLTAQNWADRKGVADKLLQVLPVERMAQMRDPESKRRVVGSSAALTASEAFNGSDRARMGHHNDCFVSSSNDLGTYNNAAVDYPYLEAETTYLPMGGETCRVNAPRSDCPTALAELSRFHWSYMNEGFHETVLNSWKTQGCFTQIQQKLGYRFVLKNGAFSSSAKPGGSFGVNFTIENQGWAAPYNSRDVELVLRNTASGELHRIKLNADPRKWLAGQSATVNQTVTLPANMAKGNYTALLNLPDPMSSLRNRAEYAIQLANTGTWEANTGFNSLNHTATIAP